MKYFATLALFLFFAASLFGVKYAESYSAHYQKCAAHWMEAARTTQLYPRERAELMQKLAKDERPVIEGQICPRLLADHKDAIELRFRLKS